MILHLLIEAAQQVATVAPHVIQAAQTHEPVDQITWGNIAGAGAVIAFLVGVGFKLDSRNRDRAKDAKENTDRIMRESREDAERLAKDSRESQERILSELGKVNSGLGERVKTLENKTHDFMTRSEIMNAIEHEKGNRGQADRVLETWMGKLDEAQRRSNDDIVTLKEKARSSESAIQEIKALIKEQNAETKALIKEFAEENKTRFDQVCDSIREVRDVRAR